MAACVKGSKIEEALKLFSYMTDPLLLNKNENENENENKNENENENEKINEDSSPLGGEDFSSQNNPYAHFKVPLVRDTYSFGTALHALGKQGSWAKSLALLHFLHEKTPLERTTVMVSTDRILFVLFFMRRNIELFVSLILSITIFTALIVFLLKSFSLFMKQIFVLNFVLIILLRVLHLLLLLLETVWILLIIIIIIMITYHCIIY